MGKVFVIEINVYEQFSDVYGNCVPSSAIKADFREKFRLDDWENARSFI